MEGLRPPRPLVADDFDVARAVATEWFGHPVGLTLHRLFFDQLGPQGVWLARHDGSPAGFLLGIISQSEPDLAYVHMHVVDPVLRGQGVGSTLYRVFAALAVGAGCTRIRALAAPHREGSIQFHRALGFAGPLVADYLGPGEDRIVFERPLPLA
ncbi:MAG: GNAT family N-acetyltransferase [Thermoleophilia bacterium]|nr:GNAT family N-acetyltransferase [Thermoleophilia bacterium]